MKYARQPTIIALLSALSVCVGVTAFIIAVWMLVEERAQREQVRDERIQLIVREQQAASVHALVRDTSADRQELSQRVAQHDVSEIVTELERAGSIAGVAVLVDAVSTDTFAEGEEAPVITLTLRANGPFGSVFHFLELLETLPHASSIVSTQFERDAESGEWEHITRIRVVTTEDSL